MQIHPGRNGSSYLQAANSVLSRIRSGCRVGFLSSICDLYWKRLTVTCHAQVRPDRVGPMKRKTSAARQPERSHRQNQGPCTPSFKEHQRRHARGAVGGEVTAPPAAGTSTSHKSYA